MTKKTKIIGLIILALVIIFFIIPTIRNSSLVFRSEKVKRDCVSNQNPVFTHDITDISKIRMIVPPGSIETYEGNKIIKPHSYVLVKEQVPIYAPADGTLVEGAYYFENGNVYYLHFQTSCEIIYRFDHVMDPIKEIKDAFPPEPALTTHTMSPTKKVEVEAGQLIGYSVETVPFDHGIWFDFGVENTEQKKDLSHLENQGLKLDERDYQSVCPYDFFQEDMWQKYYSLFGNYKDNGVVPTLYCN